MSLVERIESFLNEATPPSEVEDLRKLIGTKFFKGWKKILHKKDVIYYQKDRFVFSIDARDGFPSFTFRWPKTLGYKWFGSQFPWFIKDVGDQHVVTDYSDEEDWPQDSKNLKKVGLYFVKQASK